MVVADEDRVVASTLRLTGSNILCICTEPKHELEMGLVSSIKIFKYKSMEIKQNSGLLRK